MTRRISLAVTIVLALLAAPGAQAGTLRVDGASGQDAAGFAVSVAGDVNADGHTDLIVGAPTASPLGRQHAGAAYVVFGPLGPGRIDLASLGSGGYVIAGDRAEGTFGTAVAAAGDVNGDGIDDVVVGSPGAAPDQEGPRGAPGRAYVIFGSRTTAPVDVGALGERGFAIVGEQRPFPDAFGWSVAGVGDVNGDHLADVAIAAPGNSGFEDSYSPGRAYVVFGRRATTLVHAGRLGRGTGIRLTGGGTAGPRSVAAAGDFNRDGRPDVVIGDTQAAHNHGGAYVLLGGRGARLSFKHLGRRGLLIAGAQRASDAGYVVSGGEDFDGDGSADVVLAAPQGRRTAGGAFVVFGRRSRAPIELANPSPRALELRGVGQDWAGFGLAFLGKVDDDQRADLAITARGSVDVVFGHRASGLERLAVLTRADGFTIDGHIEPNAGLTATDAGGLTTLGPGGDLDADGRADVLAGAPAATHNDRPGSGAAYVFFAR